MSDSQAQEDQDRFLNWCLLIPGYVDASRGRRKSMKDQWREKQMEAAFACVKKPTPRRCIPIEECYEEEEEVMNTAAATLTVQANSLSPEKKYLVERANAAKYVLVWDKLHKQFNLQDDDHPRTYKELRERLESGKFTLPQDDTNDPEDYRSVTVCDLRWRDPSKKPDKEGYIKACAKLNTLLTDTLDTIHIKDPEEGLKAVKRLETEKFH